MREVRVRLEPVVSADYPQFRRDIQEAFSVAVVEEFGDQGCCSGGSGVSCCFGGCAGRRGGGRLSGCFRIRWCGRR